MSRLGRTRDLSSPEADTLLIEIPNIYTSTHLSLRMTKPTNRHVRPAKTQISLKLGHQSLFFAAKNMLKRIWVLWLRVTWFSFLIQWWKVEIGQWNRSCTFFNFKPVFQGKAVPIRLCWSGQNCCCCLFRFNVAFNNFSVISRRCLVATGSSVLTFIVLPHWSIMSQTLDMMPHPVTLSWHWVDQS